MKPVIYPPSKLSCSLRGREAVVIASPSACDTESWQGGCGQTFIPLEFITCWTMIRLRKKDFTIKTNWRGVGNMALSDSWSNMKFSLWFTSIHKANWKENVAIHQKSLRALFQAPLQFSMTATNATAQCSFKHHSFPEGWKIKNLCNFYS